MTKEEAVKFLVRKNVEINQKFANTIEEILRNKDIKLEVNDLKKSVEFTLEDIVGYINRKDI